MDIYGLYLMMCGCVPNYCTFTPTSQWLRNAINTKHTKLRYILAAYELKAHGQWYIKTPYDIQRPMKL